ncbi:phosphatase PAP2 family protein [Clostridium estertheticum]|uniref:phosphatase PAP2 family protein n=1 Tax=Clostridium estertheticum TaxID=238834 RepID=UPI001C7D0F58|nr:phosphatase PAP2 family protein [Clostridium estertheticum]MBX4264848.1 phosphatase PAP2 family protein [Clostridium estertheticum]MBX4270959.1 phosphatase PAP2 family protein [Clostridium estertheticum]WLC81190.1 phosphatase PAP2 family protein [Clostridium estertheticum]WLC88329.1 phosphatase PAP2 family protein [Clostridium estertheticum]
MYMKIGNEIQKIDDYILFFIKKYGQNRYLDIIMPIVTFMGNMGIIWFIISIALILDKPYRMIGNSVILTLIISTIVGEGIIKHIVRRVRPCNKQDYISLLYLKPTSYSFPSGHTLSSFAAAEMLSMYFTQYKLMFMTIAFLIALSRLYLYVHYPTDVIAGVIVGILCSKIIFIVLQQGYNSSIQQILINIK